METQSTLIVDFLVLLILFCESCGRQVNGGVEDFVRFPEESVWKGNNNVNLKPRIFNWYTTPPSTLNSFNNAYFPYTNQNQGGYSWLYPNSYAPSSSSYLDYFRKGREEVYEPAAGLQYGDFYNGLDTAMSSYGHQVSHNGYKDRFGTAGELLTVNKKGFALLGLLGLMAILQGLLLSIVTQFSTTTTTTTSAPGNRSLRSVDSFPYDDLKGGDEKSRQVLKLVLPSLLTISQIRSGALPISCALRELCFIDRVLKEQLQENGVAAGDKLFAKIEDFLENDGRVRGHRGYLRMHLGLVRSVRQRNLGCSFYPICREMRTEPSTLTRIPLLTLQEVASNY